MANQICRRTDQSRHPRGHPWRGCDETAEDPFQLRRPHRPPHLLAGDPRPDRRGAGLDLRPFFLESEKAAVLIVALTSQFIWLLSLWPILAVGSKRLHDRNKNGWWLLAFWLLPVALLVGGFSIVFFDDPRTGQSGDFSTASILIFASLPPALWGIVELGILPGAKGPNPYGADPRNS